MKKTLKTISLLLVVALITTACTTSTKENQNHDYLTLNLEGGDWGYPSPYTHYARGPGIFKMKLIFDSLLEKGEEGMIPWLAKDWEIDDTGLLYSFVIEEGIKWHDGQALTTEDIKFTFNYYKDHPPVTDDLNLSENDYIEDINIIDDTNFTIAVKSPDATLLERFGTARILPKHIWENIEDPIKFSEPEAVIGCGPYKLTDYNKEQGAYQFEKFEDYWGPKILADKIRFIPISDSILAFENGDIDLTKVTPDILAKYEDKEEYKIIENPAFWGYKLIFNMDKRPELKDKDLRRAIAHGTDTDDLIEKVARGAGKPASAGYLPLEHQMYNNDVSKYDFDIEKSKSLVNNNKYDFSLLTGNSNAEIRIGELLKTSLEKIGISLEITSLDTKSRDAAIKSGDYEIVLNGHGGWGYDPDLLRKEYNSEYNNILGYNNEEIDSLSNKQLFEVDLESRKNLVFDLQKVISDELPLIPLYNTSDFVVYRPEKYNNWKHIFNHHEVTHNKISYLEME